MTEELCLKKREMWPDNARPYTKKTFSAAGQEIAQKTKQKIEIMLTGKPKKKSADVGRGV